MSSLPYMLRGAPASGQGVIPLRAIQASRASESGFTLYQLLVSLVALVMAVSLGLAYHHSRHPKPFFADLERLETQ